MRHATIILVLLTTACGLEVPAATKVPTPDPSAQRLAPVGLGEGEGEGEGGLPPEGEGDDPCAACPETHECGDGGVCVYFPTCGDGLVEDGEDCEDGVLRCSDYGYDRDDVIPCRSCNFESEPHDFCQNEPDPTPAEGEGEGEDDCGNGVVDPGEECDGYGHIAVTCASLTGGSHPNGPVVCDGACRFYDGFCYDQPVCGNGQLQIGEECELAQGATDYQYTGPYCYEVENGSKQPVPGCHQCRQITCLDERPPNMCAFTNDPNDRVVQGDVVLGKAADIELLRGCEVIIGSLYIQSDGSEWRFSIPSLEAMSYLKEVTGDLIFYNVRDLPNLHGLENLEVVGGTLRLEMAETTAPMGLSKLRRVGGQLTMISTGFTSLQTSEDTVLYDHLESIGVLYAVGNVSLPSCELKNLEYAVDLLGSVAFTRMVSVNGADDCSAGYCNNVYPQWPWPVCIWPGED